MSLIQTFGDYQKTYPIITAMIQFAVLGTVGEMIGSKLRGTKFAYSPKNILSKMIIWAVLAVAIKYAFVGFGGFTEALLHKHFLPAAASSGVFKAFFISFFTNIMFGPLLILGHRYMDNIAAGIINWKGIKTALLTLIWFWIPAHTVTFILPPHWRISLAAVWSVVLGIIMGYANRKN